MKNVLLYTAILVVFGAGIWKFLSSVERPNISLLSHPSKNLSTENSPAPAKPTEPAANRNLENPEVSAVNRPAANPESSNIFTFFIYNIYVNLHKPLSLLFMQLLTILFLSRLCSILFKKMGQPAVIGEIFSGILLGPSALGLILPEVRGFLFPENSIENLQLFSQVGLVLFMFIIGMELDLKVFIEKANAAILISHSGIILPFFLGILLSYFLYLDFAPSGLAFQSFALFMGVSMSMTAFPVLARIIQERGMSRSVLGNLALSCAAIGDITAWFILALIVSIVKSTELSHVAFVVTGTVIFTLIMALLIRPIFQRMSRIYVSGEILGKGIMAVILFLLISSALFTEILGVHALFGAFLAGVIMPSGARFRGLLTEKLETVGEIILLPLFFAITGLRTKIGLLIDPSLLLVTGLILITAITGKLGGGMLAARFAGSSWRDSLALGALLNTRGLMELIVLNIGYELGIFSDSLFAMLVVMALVTTAMTGPLLNLAKPRTDSGLALKEKKKQRLHLLLAFGPSASGMSLLRLAEGLVDKKKNNPAITALHLTPSSEYTHKEETLYRDRSFGPVIELASRLNLKIETEFKISSDVSSDIIKIAKHREATHIFMGAAKTIFGDNIMAGKVGEVIRSTKCGVGIFLDRLTVKPENILLIHTGKKDDDLMEFAERYSVLSGLTITVLSKPNNPEFDAWRRHFQRRLFEKSRLKLVETVDLKSEIQKDYHLIAMGYDYWMTHGLSDCRGINSSLFILRGRIQD